MSILGTAPSEAEFGDAPPYFTDDSSCLDAITGLAAASFVMADMDEVCRSPEGDTGGVTGILR